LRRAQRLEGTGSCTGAARQALRHALDVRLVDHRAVPRYGGARMAAPGEGAVHDLALRHREGVVPAIEGKIAAAAADAVSEMRIRPSEGAEEGARIRIDEKFVGVEALALGRLVGSVHAV